jgi:hypothetical protein
MRGLCFLVCTFLSSYSFSKTSFKTLCDAHLRAKSILAPDVFKTVDVLFKKSQKQTCAEAEEYLNSSTYLDLSDEGLTTLKGLDSLEGIEVLNIRHNDLVDLWGIENLQNLLVLKADHNKLRNVSALVFLKNLVKLDVSFNQLDYLSPLKEMQSIKLKAEGNNVSELRDASDEMTELDYVESLVFMREVSKGDPRYDFEVSEENTVEDIKETLEGIAERGDFSTFRKLLAHEVSRGRLLDQNFILSATTKQKKMILALTETEMVIEGLFVKFKNLFSRGNPLEKTTEDFFEEKKIQLKIFFEYYLAEGSLPPYDKNDLRSLERFLHNKMGKRVSWVRNQTYFQPEKDLLHPRLLQDDIFAWSTTRLFPNSIRTGFEGM